MGRSTMVTPNPTPENISTRPTTMAATCPTNHSLDFRIRPVGAFMGNSFLPRHLARGGRGGRREGVRWDLCAILYHDEVGSATADAFFRGTRERNPGPTRGGRPPNRRTTDTATRRPWRVRPWGRAPRRSPGRSPAR